MRELEAFLYHGAIINELPAKDDGQAKGDCIFCGREGHFFIQPKTGLWDCKSCGASGNVTGFLECVHDKWLSKTKNEDYLRLKKLRDAGSHLPFQMGLLAWDGDRERWILPVRSVRGYMCNLRLWREVKKGTSSPWMNTKGLKSGLWGMELLGEVGLRKRRVWIAEGEWDGMLLRWAFKKAKVDDLVVAVPGANIMKKEWLQYFTGRNVVMAYDADATGDNSMVEKGKVLKSVCRSVKYIRWPLDIRNKYDVSDLISEAESPKEAHETLMKMVAAEPRTVSMKVKTVEGKKPESKKGKVTEFSELLEVYEDWLDMSDDSIMALKLVAGVVLSNQMSGDPLWLYLVSPPGGGKTALINPLRGLDDHCIFKSNLTTHMLVSGWQSDTDPSLLAILDGKTLVLKDLTELLAAPQYVQEEVFGTLRGAYDGSVDRSFGNNVTRKYELSFSMVAGVTVKIHGHKQANMGERLVKFQMSRRQEEQETIIRRAIMNIGHEEKMEEELSDTFDRFLSREVPVGKLYGRVPKEARDRIVCLAQLISKLRMEVERDYRGDQVQFRPQDEIGSRIGKQLMKTAMLMTEINKNREFGPEEWKIVERVAFDTAIGWNLDVVQAMMADEDGTMTKTELVEASRLPPTNVERRLEDLLIMGAIHKIPGEDKFGSCKYKVNRVVQELWHGAKVEDDHTKIVGRIRKYRKYKIRTRLPKKKEVIK